MSNSSPKISVIMPAYNAEKFIAESIESVLNQSFEDFELLVVNDASTDGTEKIVCGFLEKDSRVYLLQNNKGKGVSGGINTGLERARGRYIARADADDINRSYRFEKQIQYLEANPNIDLLGGGYAPFNEKGHRLDIFHPTLCVEIAWRFVSNSFFCHPTVMFRREVFEKLGGYPNVEAEDFSYFSRVTRSFQCANLPVILIDYRESLTNRSFSAAEKIAQSVKQQSMENFRYYVGDEKYAELFFRYQNGNNFHWKDGVKILRLNAKILSKIRKNYGISFFSGESLKSGQNVLRDFFKKTVTF